MGRISEDERTDEPPESDDRTIPFQQSLEGVAFWGAVTLPLAQVSLLATGVQDRTTAIAFAALFGLNVVALVAGHSYRRD